MKTFQSSSLVARAPVRAAKKSVLVVDVGGRSVKILVTGQTKYRSFRSGPSLTPSDMVEGVKRLAADWRYDMVSVGYPGPVLGGRPIGEPRNLRRGWVGFDFARAFGRPVKVINDAAMQALGSYHGGKMLFLGLGTGLGTAMVVDGVVAPMEIGHLPYKKATYEHYVGRASLERRGKRKWRRHVEHVVRRLIEALRPDYTVIGGGNVTKLKTLPPHCQYGNNANAFRGGFQLWAEGCVIRADRPNGCPHRGRKKTPQTGPQFELPPTPSTDGFTEMSRPGSRGDNWSASRATFVTATTRCASRIKRKHTSTEVWRAS